MRNHIDRSDFGFQVLYKQKGRHHGGYFTLVRSGDNQNFPAFFLSFEFINVCISDCPLQGFKVIAQLKDTGDAIPHHERFFEVSLHQDRNSPR